MRHVLLPLTSLASEVTTTVTGFGRDITVRQTLNLGYWCHRSAYQWEAAGGAVISYQRNYHLPNSHDIRAFPCVCAWGDIA